MVAKLNLSDALKRLKIYRQFYSDDGLSEEELLRLRRNDLRSKHPDRGGDADAFALANEAWDRVMKHINDKKMDAVNRCPKCGGTGLVDIPGAFNTHGKCPSCKGRGRID